MEDKQILLDNINKVHTTEMGINRIIKNLKLNTNDVVEYCKNKVLDKNCNIYKQGKNWYCEIENIIITINSYLHNYNSTYQEINYNLSYNTHLLFWRCVLYNQIIRNNYTQKGALTWYLTT